ncbi:MAG: hypothetical protein M1536_04765, partial [Firmicutes bacterium]|nr:hypothetical protein [Bacillota bacterium]
GTNAPVYAFPMAVGRTSGNVDTVMPCYEEAAPYLIESFKLIEKKFQKRAWVTSVQDVPFCFLKGMERYIHEINYAETTTICSSQQNESIEQEMKPGGDAFYLENEIEHRLQKKTKLPSCRECIYFLPCEGVQKEYIEHYGANEFVPVTSHDSSVKIKENLLTFEGSLVPVIDTLCRFNGRDFGGFLIKNEILIAVTKRGRQALRLLTGEYTLSEISELFGSGILPFIVSLKERGVLKLRNTKTIPQGSMRNLLNQITMKSLTGSIGEAFELPLYIPWHESYQVTLT